jgi:hypothetical protein
MAHLVLISRAVEETDYSARHIRLLLTTKTVKGEKQGGTWLVDLDDLKDYAARMKAEGNQKFTPRDKRTE